MIDITVPNKGINLSWIPCIFENIDSLQVQCLQANLHFPIEHILLGIKKNTWKNVWVIV